MVSKAQILLQRSFPTTRKAAASKKDSADYSAEGIPPANVFHLELFNHFISDLCLSFGFHRIAQMNSALEMTGSILSAQYLVNEIMAFSALHLSIIRPEKKDFYHDQAAQLQTYALTAFNSTGVELTTDSCLPMFLFSSILAMHMLCDKLVFRPDTFDQFLDDFIQSLRLHRGIRVVTSRSWQILLESPLGPVLEGESKALDAGAQGNECSDLLALVDSMTADPSTKDIYRQTIEHLQRAINAGRVPSSTLDAIGPIVSWPVIIPPQYVDLLAERRPETLAILAYFAALLHIHHKMWTFADSGRYIVLSVNEHLGPSWERWLRWPNETIQNVQDSC
ncbi:hypothetical protein PHISP_05774 [Aspergillus sp. HF37]|nr:hypothetical protein PHISP_05774 [Aspergillus sp. HF37]